MVQTAERSATDLRLHITELNNRLLQYEQKEQSDDMTIQELRQSLDTQTRSLRVGVGDNFYSVIIFSSSLLFLFVM